MQFKLFLMILLLTATLISTCLADKMQEKPNESLKDDDGESVDSKALVSDLQGKKRVIFAVGLVSSKMTLFISGPGGKSDTASGCTVQVKESSEGVFRITNPPEKMPAGVASADVIFVCVDSPDSRLVTMSSSSVDTVKLPGGGSEPTKITDPRDIAYCHEQGGVYLSSSNALHYYVVRSSGVVEKFHFDKENIPASSSCIREGNPSKLCINDDKVTIKKDCSGSSIPGLVSGYVTASIAYLFTADNTVYVFAASAFSSGQPTDLKKVTSKDAWKSSANVHPSSNDKPEPKVETTSATDNSTLIYVVLGILALLLLIFLCILVYCCCFRGKNTKEKKKEGGGAAGKKEKSKRGSKKSGGSKKKKSTISSTSADKAALSKGSPSKKKGGSSKSSKGKGGSLVRSSRRSSTKLPKKSASRKTTAGSSRK